MATTNTITSTYAGTSAGKFISPALLSGVTLDANAVEVLPNIKFKQKIGKFEVNGIIKNASCVFDASGTITQGEKILEPKELEVNIEVCKSDYHNTWESVEQGYSTFDVLPKTIQELIISTISAEVAQATEMSLWNGTNTAGKFPGFVTIATADADVIDVAAGTVTAANVLDELQKVIDKCPSTIYSKDDLTLYISQNIFRAYVTALGGFGTAGLGAAGTDNKGTQWYQNGQALTFGAVKIFVTNGLTDNQMLLAQKSNLFFGTGLMNDLNKVQLIDMEEKTGDDTVRFIMKFTAAAAIGYGAEVVLYS